MTAGEIKEAFVVWLDPGHDGECAGSVEHVPSSERQAFASPDELIDFLVYARRLDTRPGETPMIQIHHLNNSRSQRILWLLEELGVDYEVVKYERDSETNLAPQSLESVHPLGKSPVVVDGDDVVIESGAIVEYLARRYGGGRLMPAEGTPEALRHLQLMHYAEGSAALPLMLKLYTGRLGEAAAPLQPRIEGEIERHIGYLEGLLEGRDWFVADDLTAADIQLSFVIQAARMLYGMEKFPNLAGYLDRIAKRPAYQKAIERGGTYAFG